MCGRFALYASENEIVSHFGLRQGFAMRPRYNIAPSQPVPVILSEKKQVTFAKWGYVPPWAQADDPGYINARLETLNEKPAFRKGQPCLIPASGYYEWRPIAGKKQPFYVTVSSQKLFALAGIFSSNQTFAVITMPATDHLLKIHERMPLVLSSVQYDDWLAGKPLVFEPEWIEKFKFYAVSASMNRPEFEGVACIQAL